MSRWAIRLEAEDGQSQIFGTWRDSAMPDRHAKQLREMSSRYGGDGPEVAISVELIESWPGIRSLLADFRTEAK